MCHIPREGLNLPLEIDRQHGADGGRGIDAIAAHIGLHLVELNVHEVAVPEPLQEMESGALPAIEKPEPDHITIEEIQECPPSPGQARIDVFLYPAFEASLLAASEIGHSLMGHETVFEVQEIDHLAACIGIVLLGPPGQMEWLPPSRDGIAMCQDRGAHSHNMERTAA